jgi:hypothetical protein
MKVTIFWDALQSERYVPTFQTPVPAVFFLQGGTHYIHAKWPDFFMMKAGQYTNILVV